ncbi:MAG TPA: amino acid permease [Chitinophaga sp.]|uniref:APC family permease n=1 Tax=Chitinophaga sp. TaxID=1869181 RepID=UPI002C598164|nr:amino acid permease [Chitinophaga sp.]HVI48662.1 amino acid permease [Chitinophaga sp.]
MPASRQLRHVISFRAATAIVAGCIIGSGIFMKPATMAAQVGSPVLLALVWIVAGIFSLFGALIFAEAGAMFPQTGGIYVYFRHMFGDFFAFLYGWAGFAVINSASVAAIAFVCAQYANYLLHLPELPATTVQAHVWHIPFLGNLYPLQDAGVKALAIAMVLGLTLLNYLSVKASSALQVVSTVIKVVVIIVLVAGIFCSGKGSVQHFFVPVIPAGSLQLAGGVVSALTGAFMAYDGWINITFLGGELKSPQRDIPRSLILGLFICIAVYLLITQAYLYVLPVQQMAKSPLVAADAITVSLGVAGGAVVAGLIVICTFGAVNGNTMAIARVTYAMGKDGLFFPWTGREHPRYRTPGNALWLHGIWITVLIISGSFDMLADMFTFVAWVVYMFGGVGLFILRRKIPDHPRPYKTWGYPVVPVLFIAFAAFYVCSTVWNDIDSYSKGKTQLINSLTGLVITAAGAPLYLYFRHRHTS